MELYSVLHCASLDGRGVWRRRDTCLCMAESLHSSPETITTLLTCYTSIQNKKLKKKYQANSIARVSEPKQEGK